MRGDHEVDKKDNVEGVWSMEVQCRSDLREVVAGRVILLRCSCYCARRLSDSCQNPSDTFAFFNEMELS
jgi:hypothetical protein